MQPLAELPFDPFGAADAAPGSPANRIVLPRFLRRPARMLERIDWRIPERAGVKAVAALFLVAGIAGAFAGGHVPAIVGSLTADVGLGIAAVRITGQSETSEVDVLGRLAIPSYASMVLFDAESARRRVEDLPWVETATIRKLYPGTLDITIAERSPFAIWQRGGLMSLIDEDGRVISEEVDPRYATLPLVIGNGAAARAQEVVDLIAGYPELQRRLRGATLVAERRWTLNLEGGIAVLLPEEQPAAALAEVMEADTDVALLARAIAAVDMRLPDRMVVRLTDAALEEVHRVQRARAGVRRGGNA